ncbi:MAG: hypothetical protein JWO32_853 [Bacteroidetes bacterium]|nr:hypothetical protein [Bacteroidota bacterium]
MSSLKLNLNNFKNAERIFIVLVFLAFICINFMVPKPSPTWEHCADCNDYKVQGVHPLFSQSFLYPAFKHYSPRPFTVPLFYRPFIGNDYAIVDMQKWLLCFCGLFFVLAVLSLLSNIYVRLGAILFLFFYFTWWPIAGWVNIHLSESISLSLMFAWMASFIFYLKKGTWKYLILNLLIAFFFSFTRDSWPYSLLVVYGLLFIFSLIKKENRLAGTIAFVFIVILFFFQNFTSVQGVRYRLPVFNSITGRVSKSPEHLDWFRAHGMPKAQQVHRDFSKIDIEVFESTKFLFSQYSDTTYASLFNWIEKDGKNVYTRFLLTHPAYTFLLNETGSKRAKIFHQDLHNYIGKPQGFFANAYNFFSLFGPCLAGTVTVACLFLYFKKNKSLSLLTAPLILMFAAFNIIIIYNADALESERHLFFITVLFNLGTVVGTIVIADSLLWKGKEIN